MRGFRVTVGGGTATMTRNGALLEPFIPVERDVQHRRGDRPRLPQARRLRAQAAQPDEVPDQDDRVGSLRRGVPARAGAVPRRGRRDAAVRPQNPPVEVAPDWQRAEPPSVLDIITRVSKPQDLRGPGIVPVVQPDPAPSAALQAQWRTTNVLPQKQAGYVMAVVTTILGDLTSHQLRVLADLAEAYSDGSMRVTAEQNLLFRWVQGGRPRRAAHAARRRRPRPRRRQHGRRRHQLPRRRVVPPRGDAIARPGLRCSAITCATTPRSRRWRRTSTSRSAAAPTAAASTTSPASASRAASARSATRPCRSIS